MSASRLVTSATAAVKARSKKNPAESLQTTLQWLNKEPRPVLNNIRALSLTYTIKNAHFGARHFAKEDLPRISYANQNLKIFVDRKHQETEKESVTPTMSVEFENGDVKDINMTDKTSSTILEELLALDRSS